MFHCFLFLASLAFYWLLLAGELDDVGAQVRPPRCGAWDKPLREVTVDAHVVAVQSFFEFSQSEPWLCDFRAGRL